MDEARKLPTVAILGRPNVGKSTLFNRILGGRRALVHDRPGVTRDRLAAEAEWDGRHFRLVDTGGFELEDGQTLPRRVREQSLRAISEADVVLFVVDGRAGIAPADVEMARLVARSGKKVACVVNKIDGPAQESGAYEFYRLGLGEPMPVSAEHTRRIDELLDRIVADLPRSGPAEETPAPLRLAIVGRPNVGKSSLLNRLVGEERVVVDATAGTTRDSVDIRIGAGPETVELVDTAGIRRRSRIDEGLERASVAGALRSLERCDVALLVVDAAEGVTDQDARLARLAWERGRGILLVANKWDLVARERRDPDDWGKEARRRYAHLAHVPVVFVSALRGTGIAGVLPAVRRVEATFRTRIATRTLNTLLEDATAAHEAPRSGGKRARVYYAAAVATAPPTVVLFVNDPARFSTAYLRYLENRIRGAVPLEGSPLRLVLRARPRTARGVRRRRRDESPASRGRTGGSRA